ncbi:hypothetical protein CPB83DRAFT_851765 [Crepidotus variabilis]|uniref:Ubinuclein middle domain-containing protein n=1 Tax=Crepidotus variabilis TaxID=179855 RepID=A0A9P6JRU6_9AGAR|nr:hypothetical protein CPB83DRAFT_851765 [Crepidotus variabilis]
MASDVEMDSSINELNTTGIAITNSQSTGASKISIPVLVHSPSPTPSTTTVANAKDVTPTSETVKAGSKPASATGSSSAAAAAGTTTKPRSTKATKARSPSPSPPPPPAAPLQTIRLNLRLGGPSNYEVDISQKAKETGQRPPTPEPVVKKVEDSSDEEEEPENNNNNNNNGEEKKDGKPKRKRRKNAGSEYYDTSDPFIDDSELALDERQFFAQTKQQGFYVSSGEVALMKDKTPKKPKSKKLTFATGNRKESIEGSRTAPITIEDDKNSHSLATLPTSSSHGHLNGLAASTSTGSGIDTAPNTILKPSLHYAPGADPVYAGQKRKRSAVIYVQENGKKKKVVDESAFHEELQEEIKQVKELIRLESWEQKGKFPPGLKPPLAKLALCAIRLDEYDDDFFSLMPQLFPYNKFTMTKLIKRTVFPEHMALLTERQEILLKQLDELAKDGFSKAEEEWEKSVQAWDKRQEKIRAEAADGGGTGGSNTGSAAPTRHPTEEMDVDEDGNEKVVSKDDKDKDGKEAKDKDGKDGKDKDGKEPHTAHPPAKRYRLTEQMKSAIWELVLLSNECCRLENEKNGLEGSVIQVSDQGLRKVLYQKIVAAFPEGWMSSGQISRDVSAMKKKLEKEAMEQGDDD